MQRRTLLQLSLTCAAAQAGLSQLLPLLASGRMTALSCRNLEPNEALAHTAWTYTAIKTGAKNHGLAGGASNSPAVLLRSGARGPHGRLGGRTFLHLGVMSSGVFAQKEQAWRGAPQPIATGRFLPTQAIDGPMGDKLEAPPLHPLIVASTVPGLGEPGQALRTPFAHNHTLLAQGLAKKLAGRNAMSRWPERRRDRTFF